MMEGNSERRRYPRVNVHVPVRFKELSTGSETVKCGLTKNLSSGGVRFNTNRFISLARRMVVEVNISEEADPIRAISKVAWIKKLPAGDDYEVGNQFLDMTKQDKALILSYVTNAINGDNDNLAE